MRAFDASQVNVRRFALIINEMLLEPTNALQIGYQINYHHEHGRNYEANLFNIWIFWRYIRVCSTNIRESSTVRTYWGENFMRQRNKIRRAQILPVSICGISRWMNIKWKHYSALTLNKQRIKAFVEYEFSLSTQKINTKACTYCKIFFQFYFFIIAKNSVRIFKTFQNF